MASLVPSYDSDEPEGDEQAPACAAVPPPSDAVKKKKAPTTFTGNFFEAGAGASSSDEDSGSDDGESDEQQRRAQQAQPAPAAPSLLPSVSDVFSVVDGPPAFLRPEATRPIAVSVTHAQARTPEAHPGLLGGSSVAGSSVAVIGAAPRRYTAEESQTRAALTALRREEAEAAAAEAAAAASAGSVKRKAPDGPGGRGDFRSSAVAVQDVFANPSINLPRDRQERKDKERAKRERGQSAIGTWKSEAEMALRQQYDS